MCVNSALVHGASGSRPSLGVRAAVLGIPDGVVRGGQGAGERGLPGRLGAEQADALDVGGHGRNLLNRDLWMIGRECATPIPDTIRRADPRSE